MTVPRAQSISPTSSSPHLSGSAFSLPGFRFYWAGRLCASLATQMQSVAIGWQVFDLTQRPLDLGLVGLAQFLPALGLALVTGHIADRYDRRRILALCVILEALCALLLLSLTIQGNGEAWRIFAILFLFGIARAFEFPASVALMPNLIPQHQFASAAAWSSSAWQTATIVGPAVGGLLYALGPVVVYSCCGGLLCTAAVVVSLIRIERSTTVKKAVTWDSLLLGLE